MDKANGYRCRAYWVLLYVFLLFMLTLRGMCSFAALEAREVVGKKQGKVSADSAEAVNQLFRITSPDDSFEPTYKRTLEIQERYAS